MPQVRCTHFYDWPSLNEHSFESALNEFVANGVNTLTFATYFTNYVYGNPNKAVSLQNLLDKTGVTMPDAHGLWGGLWDLCAKETFMRPHLAAGHRLCMEILADFGVKTYTVHIGAAECLTNGGLFTPEMLARARATLEAILPTAEKTGMVVCVENAFEPANTPAAVLACIEPFLSSPAIGVCLDVGHAHVMNADLPRTDKELADNWIAEHVWGGRIRAGVTFEGMTERTAALGSLPGYADLGLLGDIQMTRNLGFWLKFGNLLDQTVQRVPFYAEKGIYFTVGARLIL